MTTISVPISKFKAHISQYLANIDNQRVRITKNGEEIAYVDGAVEERQAAAKRLDGIIKNPKHDWDKEAIREHRLKEKYRL
ncbi:MAG: type II toxin-antitoxin system prevent-host-death family antitoxin [Candidatus Nomurabacteria bacterium]|jgi:prevent-host-death family protein|nr:type II toxin-antitoxin system prevent-host-death family antitoxin [Candidatus Nomurabacteria bacterium]